MGLDTRGDGMLSGDEDGASDLGISEEFQEEIRAFAHQLPRLDYYGILGLTRAADVTAIREAFFERSRRFHPDRYFNKELGPYTSLLSEIYKRVIVANDVLRDPALRADYDRSIAPVQARMSSAAEVSPARAPQTSLRSRAGLKRKGGSLERLVGQLASGKQRAGENFEAAQVLLGKRDLEGAARLFRLALAFDPGRSEVRAALAELLPKLNSAKVMGLRRQARSLLERQDASGASALLRQASELEPANADLAHQIAELDLGLDEPSMALEFARRAVSLSEDEPRFHKTLAYAYRAAGQEERARKQFWRVWELDPGDREAKAEIGVIQRS
ncbi:MAG: DnaJ domain-containing protein [Acidobacteria bacterium]|nr:DnaJ domain-containing protein [Acidobacteriota bacterium]